MKAIIITLLLFSYNADCAKIMGIFPLPTRSHHILGSALLKELALRGHEVTMVSPFTLKNPPKNYHEVTFKLDMQDKDKDMKLIIANNFTLWQKFEMFNSSLNLLTRGLFQDENVQAFLKAKPKFDVIIHNWRLNEALLGIGHAVNATTIGFSVSGMTPFLTYLTSNPAPYAYVPNVFASYRENVTFFDRVSNTLVGLTFDFILHYLNMPYQQRILEEFFPNAPPLPDLMDNVDISFINSHVATESARPYLPNVIQIGGFHIQEQQNLTDDLKLYLDQSRNGVILFSLGSNFRSADIPANTLKIILRAFAKLKYNILWKFEDALSDLPTNVRINKWLPQRAVLQHENIKAFITHGGLGSTVEAIYHGVPMLCMPLYADQDKNAADSVTNGYAIHYKYADLSEASFIKAIEEIVENPKYKNSAVLKSDLYRNQDMNPMDKAVYWVEHVIKHKGAKHLKSRAAKIPLYQYLLIDVISFIVMCCFIGIIIVLGLLYLGVKLMKKMYKCVFKHTRCDKNKKDN